MKKFVFALTPLLLLFFLCEITLRILNFQYSDTPLAITSSLSDKTKSSASLSKIIAASSSESLPLIHQKQIIKDKDRHWVLKDSFENHHNFVKPPETWRVGALGDSCTQICTGRDYGYPKILQNLFANRNVEILNTGVGGYSSFQGLQQFKHGLLPFKPDAVIIMFGWNDLIFTQIPDAQIRIKSDLEIFLLNLLEKFKTYQAYHALIHKIKTSLHSSESFQKVPRVSKKEYRHNLNQMINIAEKNNIDVVMMTRPADFSKINLEEARLRWIGFESKAQAVSAHTEYNKIVRETARERNVLFIDLEEAFLTLQKRDAATINKVFSNDGIHYTETGCRLIAETLAEQLEKLAGT